jgi:hypothetical protein
MGGHRSLTQAASFNPSIEPGMSMSVKTRWMSARDSSMAMAVSALSKETPKDDPRQQTAPGSHKQTDKPWEGNHYACCLRPAAPALTEIVRTKVE